MAGNIKGITIEFSADASQLDRALKDVDKNTRSIDKELRNVNNALKFNPTSVDLWRQKQQLLTQKITETQTKLDLLKQKQKEMDADKSVDKNSEEYRKLQREIIATQSKLKTFKGQLQAVGNVKLRAASEQLKQIGSKATAAGHAMAGISRAAGVVAAAIGALTYKAGKWADDMNTLSKQYSIGTKDLQLYAAAAKLVDVDVESIAKSHIKMAKSMQQARDGSKNQTEAFKQLGLNVTNADGSLRDADTVWQETIQALGTMTNETERDALAMQLMGKSAKDLNPLIEDGGETYKNVAETMKKYGLDFIDQDTLNKANEFNDKIDTIKAIGTLAFMQLGTKLAGVLAPALEKVVEAVGKFANWFSNLNPVLLAVIAGIAALVAVISPALLLFGALASAAGAVAGAMAGLSIPVLAVVAGIGALVAAFATAYAQSEPFRTAINSLVAELGNIFMPVIKSAVKAAKELFATIVDTATAVATDFAPVIKALMPALRVVAKFMAGTMKNNFNLIVGVVKVLGAAIKGLSSAFSGTFTYLVSVFSKTLSRVKSIGASIKNALANPIQSAVNIIKTAMSRIKSLLSGSLSLPKIKLPHFSWSGKFSLNPPSVPKFSVNWYKRGGIFNSPTIAGIGEAGSEAVIPLDKLWQKMDAITDAARGNGNTINIYAQPGMDAEQIAQKVQAVLVRQQKQRAKAWGY